MGGGRDPNLHAGIGILERGHPGDQPFRCQRGGGADRQPPVMVGAAQPCGRAAQILEGGPHRRQVVLRLLRQCQATVLADEQLDAKLIFQSADLMADRGLGDVQFRRRERETQKPRGGFEGAQAVERGKQHGRLSSMNLCHV